MTLGGDPFAPLIEDEVAAASVPKKAKADKQPIVPVPDDAPECTFRVPALGGAPKRMWAYRDQEGRLLGYDARFEYALDGKPCKDVLPVTYCQEGEKRAWRSKALPAPRSLYGLDRLAARPHALVVIAEGCKSADAAGELLPDYVAMSWQGGGKAISLSDWRTLSGRDVLVWPDRDRQCTVAGEEKPYPEQPGTIAADNIVARLKGIARSIRVLDLADYDCAGGWDAADALSAGWSGDEAITFIGRRAVEIDQAAPGTIMPFGFEYGEDGLYHQEGDRRVRVAGRMKILAKTRDLSGTSWGLLVEWRDHDGREHRWAMPLSMLSGDGSAIREGLLDQGLYVPSDGKARQKLMEFLGTVDTPLRARAVGKVGWSGNAFALPELTIGDTADDRVIFQQADSAVHQYQTLGTLEDWQQQIGKRAIGNSRLAFMISAAFVGPVLQPACEEGGGVNLVGPSSCGKTTGLRAAASVWGSPLFIRQWRATSNGLEGVAAQHNETLLCLDELSQVEPREAGPTAYMLGNGQGKARASRTGGSRAASTWRIMYLSTGEVGLAGIMADNRQAARGPMAGQEVRILDVPADAGRGMGLFENIHGAASAEEFARQITTAASQHYGAASIEYLRKLAGIRDQVGSMIANTINAFVERNVEPGSDGQVLRAARRFGLVAAAGELAQALGVLPWPRQEAFGAATVMFRSWLDRRGGNGSAERRTILAQVRAFLEAHGDSRFSSVDAPAEGHERTVINRAGFYKLVSQDGDFVREFLVLPEAFRSEMCRGHEPSAVVKVLDEIGALRKSREGKPQVNRRLPNIGPKKVYVIGPEIFDGD